MQVLQGKNLLRIKETNQSAILRMIYYYGPISRSDIAQRLELTLPTITTNINKMLGEGLIKETFIRREARPPAVHKPAGMLFWRCGAQEHKLECLCDGFWREDTGVRRGCMPGWGL